MTKKAEKSFWGKRVCIELRDTMGNARSTMQMHRAHAMSSANSFQWGL